MQILAIMIICYTPEFVLICVLAFYIQVIKLQDLHFFGLFIVSLKLLKFSYFEPHNYSKNLPFISLLQVVDSLVNFSKREKFCCVLKFYYFTQLTTSQNLRLGRNFQFTPCCGYRQQLNTGNGSIAAFRISLFQVCISLPLNSKINYVEFH